MPVSILLQLSSTISDLRLELSAMHISLLLLLVAKSIFRFFSRIFACYNYTYCTFIYVLVTPTYLRESHNVCTKIQCVLFMYKLGPTFVGHALLAASVNIYQWHTQPAQASPEHWPFKQVHAGAGPPDQAVARPIIHFCLFSIIYASNLLCHPL